MVTFSGTPKTFQTYISEKTTGTPTKLVAAEADGDIVVQTVTAFAATLLDDADAATARTTLGAQALDSDLTAIAAAGVAFHSNYLTGFTLSNNGSDATNDIDIAAGACMDSTNAAFIILASAITKRLDASWAVGTNQGGLDTGSIANAVYHLHAIRRPDTGVVDVLFSLSATAPTMPANYTQFRRIGSIIRSGATILAFKQNGDEFLLDVPILDVDVADQGATAVSRTLSVPTGVKVNALMRIRGTNAAGWAMFITALDVADTAPSGTANPVTDVGGTAGLVDRNTLNVRTNTSAQVRSRATVATTSLQISTYGWIDTRGKNG